MPRYGTSPNAQLPVGLNGHPIARVATVEPWKARGACRGVDPDLFYPPRGAKGRAQAREAKDVCRVCPVRFDCLAYALRAGEEFGIWGGTTERERRFMRAMIARARLTLGGSKVA